MNEELYKKLERYLPVRILIRKTNDGQYEGYVEHSFSMDWSKTHVQIYWSGKAYSILGEHDLNGPAWAEYNRTPDAVMWDPLDPECPVKIDWGKWLDPNKRQAKFNARNAPFKVEHELVRAVRKVVLSQQTQGV